VAAVVAAQVCKDFCEIPASHELAEHLVDDREQDAVAGLVAFLVYEDCGNLVTILTTRSLKHA
jgi:hypothetical protein